MSTEQMGSISANVSPQWQ